MSEDWERRTLKKIIKVSKMESYYRIDKGMEGVIRLCRATALTCHSGESRNPARFLQPAWRLIKDVSVLTQRQGARELLLQLIPF
jgi:hypothetical protein